MKWPESPGIFRVILLFVVYVATCKLSLVVQTVTGRGTQIWPAAGIALAGILIWGPSVWPAIFLGTLAVHWINNDPVYPFVGPAIGNTVEPLIGAYFCSRQLDFHKSLDRPLDIMRFILGAALLGSLAGALIGVPWIAHSGYHKTNLFYFIQYWAGDYVGMLIMAPIFLVFSTPNRLARFTWKNIMTVELLLFVLLVAGAFILFMKIPGPARLYFFFPLVLWVALRLGQRGVTVTTISIAVIALWQTVIGQGPFGDITSRAESEIYLASFVATLQITGLLFASVVMGREVERTTKEEAMEKSQQDLKCVNTELEEAIRARDEFLSIASHELKTPMAPLSLRLQMMDRKIKRAKTAEGVESDFTKDLLICERSLDRLSRLTDELLSVSRIRTGHLTIQPEEINLSSLVKGIIDQYQFEFDRNNSRVELHLDDSVVGFWDRMKMEEVIVNLLTNAIKFASGKPIEIWVLHENKSAKLIVRDHGQGIAPQDQGRIFQRFERAVSSRHYGGLGLGLYISRQILQAHGGTISVESKLGDGAKFTVQVPLRAANTAVIPENTAAA